MEIISTVGTVLMQGIIVFVGMLSITYLFIALLKAIAKIKGQ